MSRVEYFTKKAFHCNGPWQFFFTVRKTGPETSNDKHGKSLRYFNCLFSVEKYFTDRAAVLIVVLAVVIRKIDGRT